MTDIPAERLLFFSGRPDALALYRLLEAKLLAAFPETRIKTQKTQISFYHKRLFACVSFPRQRLKTGAEAAMVVTFGLGCRLASPRPFCVVEPYPNRWTHHVMVQTPEALDGELMDWLSAAYAFAESKG